jgi:hypothetical protein
MPRITLKHTLVVALAASTLAASTATARQVDRFASPTSSLAGTTEKQDLRGEHAQDAARLAAQAQIERGEHVRHAFFLRRQAQPDAGKTVFVAPPKQDLRGEHAQDAARFNGQKPKPPVYWSYTYEAPKPPVYPSSYTYQPTKLPAQPVSAPADKPNDVDVWLILAIALGTTALLAGTALLVTRHNRIRVPA